MKIFEKFEGTLSCADASTLPCSVAESSWRGALEEVLGWLDHSTEHKEIADRIHEELES